MCRWLMYMRDLAGSDQLMLTQEFLAQMLGVRRPSVSIVASPLQKAGLIKYSRGHIRVLDVEGLKKEACECYETVKAHYQRLLSNYRAYAAVLRRPKAFNARSFMVSGSRSPVAVTLTIDLAMSSVSGSSLSNFKLLNASS